MCLLTLLTSYVCRALVTTDANAKVRLLRARRAVLVACSQQLALKASLLGVIVAATLDKSMLASTWYNMLYVYLFHAPSINAYVRLLKHDLNYDHIYMYATKNNHPSTS